MVAEISGMGTAIQYLDKLACIVSICLLPSGVVGNFPTVSRDTFSKVSRGVSVIHMGS